MEVNYIVWRQSQNWCFSAITALYIWTCELHQIIFNYRKKKKTRKKRMKVELNIIQRGRAWQASGRETYAGNYF
jgi:hypothetical protein